MNDFIHIQKSMAPSLPQSFFDRIVAPTNVDHDAFYVYSMHKCASTMLQRIISTVAAHNGMANISIDQWRFKTDHHYTDANISDIQNVFVEKGYWYGVFRTLGLEHIDKPNFLDFSKKSILLVRNPLDILTSLYYSHNFSHRAPGTDGKMFCELDGFNSSHIDQFVLDSAQAFHLTFMRYITKLLPLNKTKVYRYEDIIFEKERFIRSACLHLDLECPKHLLDELVSKEDVRPLVEDAHKHIRRVTPGDHKHKLQPATIERLAALFEVPMRHFDYL